MSYPSFSRGLKGFVKFKLVFENTTGLLIRMPVHAQVYRIGGADQYPMTTERNYKGRMLEVPYVPGSSFKGRMRGLVELSMKKKLYSADGKIWQHVRSLKAMESDFVDDVERRCVVDEIFGWAAANYEQIKSFVDKHGLNVSSDDIYKKLAPTRLIVTDFFPTEEYVEDKAVTSIADFLEEKSENRIDRITSAADPRSIVRVKPGVEFEGSLTLLLFEQDSEDNIVERYLRTIVTGLKLLEETYLGGSGSRGYGRIKFRRIEVEVLKASSKDGAPVLERIDIKKREFSSVSELEGAVSDLAKEVAEKVFGS